jgi:glycine cleavage system pyridoxal-binding protein P
MTEYEFANHIRLLGRTNKVYKSYLGYHPTVVPAAIQRNILKTRVGTPLTPRTKQKLHRKIRSHFEFPNYGY